LRPQPHPLLRIRCCAKHTASQNIPNPEPPVIHCSAIAIVYKPLRCRIVMRNTRRDCSRKDGPCKPVPWCGGGSFPRRIAWQWTAALQQDACRAVGPVLRTINPSNTFNTFHRLLVSIEHHIVTYHAVQEWLDKQLEDQLSSHFSTNFATLFESFDGQVPPFVTFMRSVGGRVGWSGCLGLVKLWSNSQDVEKSKT